MAKSSWNIYYHKRLEKYQARITFEGKLIHLGTFSSLSSAIIARNKALAELYGPGSLSIAWHEINHPTSREKKLEELKKQREERLNLLEPQEIEIETPEPSTPPPPDSLIDQIFTIGKKKGSS